MFFNLEDGMLNWLCRILSRYGMIKLFLFYCLFLIFVEGCGSDD